MASHPSTQDEWLSLTALGRVYGISAVQCGRLLQAAGARERDGAPSSRALRGGLAKPGPSSRNSSGTLWSRGGCGALLEDQGLESAAERRLVNQWADLLEALQQSAAALVSSSAEDLASELPRNLVAPVNAALLQRGCEWQLASRPSGGGASHRLPKPRRRSGR